MPIDIFLCRDEFSDSLRQEISERFASAGHAIKSSNIMVAPGYVRLAHAHEDAITEELLSSPFIFERQRLINASSIPQSSLKSMARAVISSVLPPIAASDRTWALHLFAPGDGDVHDGGTCRKFRSVFCDMVKERFSGVFRRLVESPRVPVGDVKVMQLFLTPEGLWASVMQSAHLSDSCVGGLHRMNFDHNSPSRSFLKIEEALEVMGVQPQPGQTVVDLGAAPGGWTWAFLKRGCHVTAVDNGPMKLKAPPEKGGRLIHLRQDGVGYVPEQSQVPHDWLVSDMLMTAGTNIGMLRKWIENRWMRRFIINVKLPQQHPYTALLPLLEYVRTQSHAQVKIRQLYHDRREVTIMGFIKQ